MHIVCILCGAFHFDRYDMMHCAYFLILATVATIYAGHRMQIPLFILFILVCASQFGIDRKSNTNQLRVKKHNCPA